MLKRILISMKLLPAGDPGLTVPYCHTPPVNTRVQKRHTRILISVRLNYANPLLHQTPRHLPYISKKSLHYSIYKKATTLSQRSRHKTLKSKSIYG